MARWSFPLAIALTSGLLASTPCLAEELETIPSGDPLEGFGLALEKEEALLSEVLTQHRSEEGFSDSILDVLNERNSVSSTPMNEQGVEGVSGSGPGVKSEPGGADFFERFNLPPQEADYKPTRALRCDVVRHLKTPSTYRRLDSYMKPQAILPEAKDSDVMGRDYATGQWGGLRRELYKAGVDLYGCYGFDHLNVIKSNVSSDPVVKTPSPNRRDQQNYVQLYGLDFYSRLVSDQWKGGQLHFSFAWPESKPIWLYGNALSPIATQAVHGNFYYDTGTRREPEKYQGFRVFEIWFQQRYGKNMENFVRVGNINPWILFNRSILAGMFNYWTFDEPGSFGTNPDTGRGPIYPIAPLGLQWYQVINDNLDFRLQFGAGYYDPTSGIDNRRGLTWFLGDNNGTETVAEFTYKGGTYNSRSDDFGLPWFVRIGGQYHSGNLYSNYKDVNGDSFQETEKPRRVYNSNAGIYATLEAMLFREKGSYNQGLTGFVKTSQYFHDYANLLKSTYVFGLGYEGLIHGRDQDVIFIGYGIKNMTEGARLWEKNSDSCALKSAGNCHSSGKQEILEIGYSAKLTPWWFVQPGMQFLIDPYGRTDLGNITTFTLSTGIAF